MAQSLTKLVTDTDPLSGWIPLFFSPKDEQITVNWGYMGRQRFVEPFCHDTLQKLATHPFNRLFGQQSTLDVLRERAHRYPGLPLKGIIFHMSRCGSTLLSQWLTALTDSVVLSEPPPLDKLLQLSHRCGTTEAIQALISAMGQPRRPEDKQLFLKVDCWHMLHIERLLEAFPDTPWFFLYRDPVEVLASLQNMPGWHMVPGSLKAHGLHPPEDLICHPLGHGAWVLSQVLEKAHLAITQYANGGLLNYSELPHALENKLAHHFHINLKAQDREALSQCLCHHSKQPTMIFTSDKQEKLREASQEARELSQHWLLSHYQKLESQNNR